MRRAAAQQVGRVATELPRARAREDEQSRGVGFHELVDDGKEVRGALDLVQNDGHGGPLGRHEIPQALGPRDETAQHFRLQQIHHQRVRKLLLQPGRLACPAWAKEEEAARRELQESTYRFHFESQKGISKSEM